MERQVRDVLNDHVAPSSRKEPSSVSTFRPVLVRPPMESLRCHATNCYGLWTQCKAPHHRVCLHANGSCHGTELQRQDTSGCRCGTPYGKKWQSVDVLDEPSWPDPVTLFNVCTCWTPATSCRGRSAVILTLRHSAFV